MLQEEIDRVQRSVKTESLQMSVGEVVSLYEREELRIDPNFQRLFRWTIGQKSKLIESILLNIPIPSIFVFERDDGTWELIDGLQRVSTILEFMGALKIEGMKQSPAVLIETKYLPSLLNSVWEEFESDTIKKSEQKPIDRALQLQIRRSRLTVQILKRPSKPEIKYDLFQRLNSGGTQANAQELRNCVVIMTNEDYYNKIKAAAEGEAFQQIIALTEDQKEKQRHMEMATRLLVHAKIDYDAHLDVEEYIDSGVIALAERAKHAGGDEDAELIKRTSEVLQSTVGSNALRRIENGNIIGKVGFVGLEGIAVGVAKNLESILKLGEEGAKAFIKEKVEGFWSSREAEAFTSQGLRGTTRIQRTVPFGATWFKP